jgi:hypothetical protein
MLTSQDLVISNDGLGCDRLQSSLLSCPASCKKLLQGAGLGCMKSLTATPFSDMAPYASDP